MKSASSGRVPSCSRVRLIDGRVGLGHVVLKAPDENVEAGEPVEFALDAVENGVAHVGEDGGADAVLLELQLPGEHGGVLRGPHARVPEVELVDGGGVEVELRIADDVLPELQAGELAFVVGVAVGPVDGSRTDREAGR